MSINSEVDAMKLIYLVLNKDEEYYSNMEKNKSTKTKGSQDKGRKDDRWHSPFI
jgi:hypothetical protein